jgi:effector-binding domain-containing protein
MSMDIQTIEAASRPMIYVSRLAKMEPAAIGHTIGEAFAALGAAINDHGIAPVDAPVAVYRQAEDGNVAIDVGFPVEKESVQKVRGEVKSGVTPSGKALKAIHRGPYDDVGKTYAALYAHLKQRRMPMPPVSWEVYVNDPQKVAPKDLVTEVYLPLA